jgi:dipeptidyl aminopeptidase/acylaminoacyl peptidase
MAAITTSNPETQIPTLIPRKTLFGNPERTSPKLSPDGKYIAFIAPDERNVLQVWLRTIKNETAIKLTNDKKRGIRGFFWTYKAEQLIYLQDADGDENFHLYLVNINSNIVKDLTPFEGTTVQVINLDPKFPDEILVGLNKNNPQKFDVYRINLNNGAVEFDTDNPGNIVGWTADAQFQILTALAATPDGGYDLLYRKTPDRAWQTLRHWNAEEQGRPYGFSKDGKTLYLLASHDADAARLLALDLATQQETVIAEDSQYDISQVVFHPTERHIQAVAFYKDKLEWKIIDPDVAEDAEAIASVRPGEVYPVSGDLANQKCLIAYVTDDGPTYYYVYDRASKSSIFLFSDRPELEQQPLVPMKPISYSARDGLTIHGYLTLPEGYSAPYPTVMLIHGGPWARDIWGYNPQVQWLANRGYAVLQPNFRGSTGYGKAFINAGNHQWGAAMHDDLIDGVNWLVNEGIAEQDKIAIMGTSYGGYATLVGLAFTPEVFACGVDIVGPSNLVTLMQSIPPYWKPMMTMFQHRVGDLETEEEFLKSRSPLFFVDEIQKPLLIGQGANDPRVKEAESEQIVDAMHQAGRSIKYALYTDEGHGFARPENRLHFYAVAEEFLAEHLGGRFEPVEEIQGHSGVIKIYNNS